MLTIMNVLVLLTVPLELFMDGFDAFSQHMLLCLARFSRSQSHAEVPTTVIQQQERNEEMTEHAQAVDNRTEADSGVPLFMHGSQYACVRAHGCMTKQYDQVHSALFFRKRNLLASTWPIRTFCLSSIR